MRDMQASQRVCSIPEVIHQIASKFGPEPESSSSCIVFPDRQILSTHWGCNVSWNNFDYDRKTLAILARCNKQFAEIALEILWRRQTSIVPLLSLIPYFKRGHRGEKKYSFTGPIPLASWKRVEYYARYIRMIYSPRPAAIEDYVFVQLAQRLKDKPLLPCLHSLSYPISAEIFLFITPSLRRVNIAKSPGRDNGPFLVALLGTTPLLEEYSGWTFSASFSTVLSKFAQLRVIDVGNQKVGNPNSLHRIFLVPLLTELRVCLAEFEPSTELADNLDAPFLRTLTLEGHPGSIRTLLTRLGSTPLVALRVEYGDEEEEPWEAQWCTRLNLIAIWSSSLETLELYDNGSDTQGTLTPSIMDQLLKMTRLKHVKLNFRPILKFDDVYMTKIARAWTRLKLLDIRFSRRVTQPLMTIVSLEAFATHCPQLHSLSLHINLQPSKLAPSPRCILCHGLQRLFIQHPVTGDAALVARHLLALFPCLQNVRSDHGDPANQDVWEGWNDVQDMIQLCRVTAEDNKMRQKKLWQSCC